jgi:LysM repeat protein
LASQQPSTVRSKRRLTIVVPAVVAGVATAGVVTAFCVSGSASSAAVRPSTVKVHAAAATKATTATKAAITAKAATTAKAAKTSKAAAQHVKVVSASKPKGKHHAAQLTADQTVWYTVQSGDSLSAIASRYYDNASAWPVVYYANEHTLNDSQTIYPGQKLRIPAKPSSIPAAPAQAASVSSSSSSDSSSASSDSSASSSSSGASDTQVDASDYSGFQECVISRESGGDSQVMNSSGHYGLYQFSYSTWVGYGGAPSEFGDATVAEQNAVFATAMADGGESNWAPYDGC